MTHTQTTCLSRITLHTSKKGARPAEVGALAPMFKNQLKQKSLKCKSTIKIATFDVRTFNTIGQLPELTASAIDHDNL